MPWVGVHAYAGSSSYPPGVAVPRAGHLTPAHHHWHFLYINMSKSLKGVSSIITCCKYQLKDEADGESDVPVCVKAAGSTWSAVGMPAALSLVCLSRCRVCVTAGTRDGLQRCGWTSTNSTTTRPGRLPRAKLLAGLSMMLSLSSVYCTAAQTQVGLSH